MLRSAQHDTSPSFSLTSGAPLLVVAMVCALASAAIWLGPGILNTRAGGDSPFLLIRTYELAANLRVGVFPARWMPDAAYGLGYPFFNFYASLPYYLAAALTVLGMDMLVGIKLTQTIGMFAAGFAMLGWARTMLPPWAATLAACAYVLAPFHLVNVYVRGDSLSEFWAFVWFPLILGGVQQVTRHAIRDTSVSRITYGVLLALSLAALVLTHNVSALIFAPFIVIYALVVLLRNATASPDFVSSCLRGAIGLGVAALLALALSAWFWLPALAEAPTVQLGDQTTGYFNYANHFRDANLVQPSLAFDYAVNENGDAFAMGLLQAALVVIGAVVWWWSNRRAKRSHFDLVLMLALFALATFMITPLSEFIWARAPLLPLTQFPWRFLSVQAVFAAVLIGGVGRLEIGRSGQSRNDVIPSEVRNLALDRHETLRYAQGDSRHFGANHSQIRDSRLSRVNLESRISILCIVLLLLAALVQLPNGRLNIVAGDVTPRTIQLYEWYTGNIGTTIRAEYLPKTALPRPYVGPELLALPREARIAQDGSQPTVVHSRLIEHTPVRQIWQIRLEQDAQVTLPVYTTGWVVGIDDQPALSSAAYPGSGWLWLSLLRGDHRVELAYAGTTFQSVSQLISLIALIVTLSICGLVFVADYLRIFKCGTSSCPRRRASSDATGWIPVLRSRGLWQRHGPKDQGTFAGMTVENLRESVFASELRHARARIMRRVGVIAGLSATVLAVLIVSAIPQPRSEDLPTLQTLDFVKRPFPHQDPVIFRAADGASYELIGAATGDPLRAGDALTLSLRWRDDRAPAAITLTQELPMGGEFANLFRYAREQSSGDPRLSRHVVPSNTLPGPLLLKLQASDANGNLLTPFNPDGSALTTEIAGKQVPAITLLGPSVTETPPNAAPPHLHTFNNGIALHKMDWLFASEQEVCFRPIWTWARDDVNRADALQVSLRLRGSDGREIATADGQPQAGLAPTWSWPAGVLINDGRCVPAQNLLNLGEPYTLQIVWYRLANLEQVAEVTLRGTMSATLREDMNVPEP
jgi:hypothetical protein